MCIVDSLVLTNTSLASLRRNQPEKDSACYPFTTFSIYNERTALPHLGPAVIDAQ